MLTAEQIAARVGKLTASRIACLMRADKDAIMRLYREMIGEELPEDLASVWPVRLGEATEALNLEWFERKNGGPLTRRGEVARHPAIPWAAATLDAWSVPLDCPVETKHVGGFEPLEIIIERYQPQCQWQMEVTGVSRCALSVIVGASEPVIEFIERDPAYAAEMIRRGEQFMACVKAKTPPVAIEPAPPPVDPTKHYDMGSNNQWGSAAWSYLEYRETAHLYENAKAILKSLVPADAKTCIGHGIRILRDRAGRLHVREAA